MAGRCRYRFDVLMHKYQLQRRKALDLFISKFLVSLRRQKPKPSGIYAYPTVFQLLSALYSLNKKEGWLFLRELQELGLIKLVPAHGVRILAEVDEDAH